MEQTASQHIKEALAFIIASLGITHAPNEVIAGLFMAFGAGFTVLIYTPENDKREPWLLLVTSVFMGLVAAIIHPFVWPEFPLSAFMFLAGAGSRFLVMAWVKIGSRTVERSDDVADTAIDKLTGGHDD